MWMVDHLGISTGYNNDDKNSGQHSKWAIKWPILYIGNKNVKQLTQCTGHKNG